MIVNPVTMVHESRINLIPIINGIKLADIGPRYATVGLFCYVSKREQQPSPDLTLLTPVCCCFPWRDVLSTMRCYKDIRTVGYMAFEPFYRQSCALIIQRESRIILGFINAKLDSRLPILFILTSR